MNLLSNTFAAFLIISLAFYYLCPKKIQWCCLLAANAVFYAFTGIGNFAFIFLSSIVTFFAARIAGTLNDRLKAKKQELSKEDFKSEKQKTLVQKRLVLVAMLFVNVGVLAYLKYINVLIGSKTLLLPLGISYYTFQSIAYFMDVYNSKYQHERNFLKYFAFISFFPQLIMGPINRYNLLGKQMQESHSFDFEKIKHGVMLILFGAMKKYAIADLLYSRVTDVLNSSNIQMPGVIIAAGILMYAVYQYADFSGGIDMVLGIAELFGLEMQPNFKQPYFSTSLAKFWQRWHISLGAWMRDYVFYPIALTKKMQDFGKWCNVHFGKHFCRVLPACVANIIVFVLVGVWHGPELHFLIWGLYNGLVIAFSDILSPAFAKLNQILHINEKSRGMHLFRILRTFFIVNIGWYFDSITDVSKSFIFLKNTFTKFGSLKLLLNRDYLITIFGHISYFESQIILVTVSTIIVFVVSVYKENKIDVYKEIQKKNIALRWLAYYIPLILVILSFSFASGDSGFMYAQF